MEMQFLHDHMETEQIFTARPTQTVVEAEVALPGGLREEARVYHADATAAVHRGEMTGSRIQAEGRVTFHVLYAQGDLAQVKALEAAADFSQALPLVEENAQQSTTLVRPKATVQHVSAKAFNGRLLLKAILQLSAQGSQNRTLSFIKEVSGEGKIERQMQSLSIQKTVGEGEGQSLIREEFELSDVLQIKDTLFATGAAKVEDILGGADGRATVTGTISLEAYHTSDMPGRPLVYTRHTMPFEQQVNLSGALGNALSAYSTVKDVAVLCQDGQEGSKIMRAEVQLETVISALEEGQLSALQDVFTLQGEGIETHGQQVIYRTGMINEQAAESGKAILLLPEGSARVKTALLSFARPILLKAEKTHGRLITEGILETSLVYMTDDSPIPISVQQEAPFRTAFSTQAEPEDILTLSVLQAEPSAITGDRVEIKYILQLEAQGIRKGAAQLIVDGTAVSLPEEEKGLALCFLQPGETLWDIAKRYRVPLQQLYQINPDYQERPGTPVIAYKK